MKIPFLRPNLVKSSDFKDYLSQIEKTNWYSNYGPLNTFFEKRIMNEFYDSIGSVTTVNNATIGLMLAINEIKRPHGRFVLMPSFTFSAAPLAAMWCGLEPYFVDIKDDDWCMNEELIKELLEKLGDEVALVMPYATFGTNLDLKFYQRVQDSGVPVVIDAAASFGTSGVNGAFGKGFTGVVVFSFHATKPFGIGEGGLVYSADKSLISKIRQAGNFGFSENRETTLQGLNSKLSEYAAAIALATLDVFSEKIHLRKRIYQWYLEELEKMLFFERGWKVQKTEGGIVSQFMPLLCPSSQSNITFLKLLADHHIEARNYFFPPCHQQSLFRSFSQTTMSVTNKISCCILSLPLWEEMKKNDVIKIIKVISEDLR